MSELFSDCNLNVAWCFLDEFRCEHPHLKTIALEYESKYQYCPQFVLANRGARVRHSLC